MVDKCLLIIKITLKVACSLFIIQTSIYLKLPEYYYQKTTLNHQQMIFKGKKNSFKSMNWTELGTYKSTIIFYINKLLNNFIVIINIEKLIRVPPVKNY